MRKKRKHPRIRRRIEFKVGSFTIVIKNIFDYKFVCEKPASYPCFIYIPFTQASNDFSLFDIRNHKCLVKAATGKYLEEIIEEQERIEARAEAFRRMYNYWVKREV